MVVYRPLVRDGAEVIEMWSELFAVGSNLPKLCLPIDLEAAYTAACNHRQLV